MRLAVAAAAAATEENNTGSKLSILQRFRFALLALCLSACSGSQPATLPAPLAEVPSAISFPESVGVDVGKATSSSGTGAIKLLVTPGGTYSTEISLGPNVINLANNEIDKILKSLEDLDIPVSLRRTKFRDIIKAGENLVALKIDFADYDFDSNGRKEGCSGNTGKLPICYRIWADNRRVLAGVFEGEFPSKANVGAGRFVGVPADTTFEFTQVPRVIYDHRDPNHKSTEIFIVFPDESDAGLGPAPHALVSQTGPDATAVKLVKVTIGNGDIRYLGRWQEGEGPDFDLWSGTLLDPMDISPDFDTIENVCASISSGNGEDRSLCKKLGIDIEGVGFIRPTRNLETLLPRDFPSSPTF